MTAKVDSYAVAYVGLDLKVDGLAVEAVSGQSFCLRRRRQSESGKQQKPLILVSQDAAIIAAGLAGPALGERPLICGGRCGPTGKRMADLAKKQSTALASRRQHPGCAG